VETLRVVRVYPTGAAVSDGLGVRTVGEHMFVMNLLMGATLRDMRIFLPPFIPDSHGNRLESYKVVPVRDCDHVRLYLCGPQEVAEQALWMLQTPGARQIKLEEGQEREWSHRIHVDGPLPESVKQTLDLLKEVLTLVPRPHLDVGVALDLYKKPDPEVDPQQWPNTAAGSMVNAAKYWSHPEAFDDLVDVLAKVVGHHKIYSAVDYVSSVPGHDTTKKSFGEQLAAALAKKLAKPLVSPRAAHAVRPAAKDRDNLETTLTLEDEFAFGTEVAGRVVLIVDDVYRTGQTMDAVAKAAKEAGAAAALGLAGAKTLRNK
jgi:Phosphoribosyl transferase domain